MKFLDLKLIVQCQCEKASFLASESLDRQLTISERWAMRLHQAVCGSCRRAARQLRELHRIVEQLPPAVRESMTPLAGQLSDQSKQRIAAAMRDTK